jgi:CheY-like chemotaxis protein
MTRILVVEDEGVIALHIKRILSPLGYEVTVASTSQEAIDLAKDLKPDVVLMDVSLRGSPLDGLEADEVIQRGHAVPVIYLTGYADEATLSQIAERSQAPLTRVLIKPVDEQRLLAALEQVLHPG